MWFAPLSPPTYSGRQTVTQSPQAKSLPRSGGASPHRVLAEGRFAEDSSIPALKKTTLKVGYPTGFNITVCPSCSSLRTSRSSSLRSG